MSNNNNPEVIDPDDQRYKDKDYFNKKNQGIPTNKRHQSLNYTKHIGCGCGPLGCFGGCFTSIIIFSLVSYLLSFLF
ncbi:hypothetical protein BU096_07545 [Staphylococcus xylosus]|uniref:hypothetical protein n=1 Tax=Staphylococcus xylosus TaxID=1288 RepID=UPI000D1EF133|nr:hypothetical protein [Staphylococcus xylosus]MRF37473.1 hypothetical protein [Staphylococcus sp. KY49P]PTI07111.1 hypothetical protein BU096_07545 [Staphylococcus xylosus]